MLRFGPHIDPMKIGNELEYGEDFKILWAAFKQPDMDQNQFAQDWIKFLSNYDSLWIVEDRNDNYPGNRGAVGMFLVKSDGFIIHPEFVPFKWATKRNIYRSVMAFLNWVRFSRDVGVCVVLSTQESKPLLWKMRDFGIMLTYIGNGVFALAGEKAH